MLLVGGKNTHDCLQATNQSIKIILKKRIYVNGDFFFMNKQEHSEEKEICSFDRTVKSIIK